MISGIWRDDNGVWWVNEASFVPKDVTVAADGFVTAGIAVGNPSTRRATADEVEIVDEGAAGEMRAAEFLWP